MLMTLFGAATLLAASTEAAATADTLRTLTLDEQVVISSLKEEGEMRSQPLSLTQLGSVQLRDQGVAAMTDLGAMVPNFYMPDYGSRQTSAIYMRGIGSRIGTPSVGLYVDNVPYYDKTGFDFALADAEHIDVLRGPQSTLYGRNTMGGLIRVVTRNPFHHEGTDVRMGLASRDNRRQLSLTHSQHSAERLAYTVSAYYDGSDGFYRNTTLDQKVGSQETLGGRLRAIYRATDRLTFDANLSYEYSDESAYPYFYTGTLGTDPDPYTEQLNHISANLEGAYRRHLLNASLNSEYRGNGFVINSVTAYQGIDDRMFMDQDFLAADIYSLQQEQRIHTLSEELVLKTNARSTWSTLTGINLFGQWQHIEAPVTFRQDGIAWLNTLINTQANAHMPVVQAGPMKMKFDFSDQIDDSELAFEDSFDTPVLGAALFHQSTLHDVMGVDGLALTAGLRLDYEHLGLDYEAGYDFGHTYQLQGELTLPNGTKTIPMVPAKEYTVSNHNTQGKLTTDYLKLMPKLSLQYDFGQGNVYLTGSYGYRSGGYSVQNISEILRSQMQADMMKQVRDATVPVLEKQPQVPADTKETVKAILDQMAADTPADIEGSCSYRPEYAQNIEAGTHLDLLDHRLLLDASAYLSQVRDLQLSRMSQTGLGRTVYNAGRSRSIGAELNVLARPFTGLRLGAAAGYTHATFRNYMMLDAKQQPIDCRGNVVPFMPEYTMHLDAEYTMLFYRGWLHALTVGADCSGVGKIWWDETNIHSQSPYALLGARLKMSFSRCEVTLWGKNLTQQQYRTFWFESMGRGFEQRGNPLQVGISAALHFE